jgi:cell division protein FtsB
MNSYAGRVLSYIVLRRITGDSVTASNGKPSERKTKQYVQRMRELTASVMKRNERIQKLKEQGRTTPAPRSAASK